MKHKKILYHFVACSKNFKKLTVSKEILGNHLPFTLPPAPPNDIYRIFLLLQNYESAEVIGGATKVHSGQEQEDGQGARCHC